ncbi:MAG: hypothetical protein JEZ03_10045 [Bacteroidales bacterium]|nr:hypothetical protein [Bacteroidales bacterium]
MKQFVLMMLVICSCTIYASDLGGKELRKIIKKEFNVQADAKLDIENKRGSIECITWEKDVVEIEVTISVRTNDENKAKEALDKINVDFDASPNFISAETEIELSDFKSVQLKYNIDFVVKMPAYLNLELENRFGDIYINKTEGKLKIDLAHGDLRLTEAIHGDMDLKFGKASIGKMEKLDLELHYMNIDIDQIDYLNLDSQFSEVDVEQVRKLVLDSQSDYIEVGEVDTVLVNGQFTSLKINKLRSVLDSDCSYGGISVKYVDPEFKSITSEHVFAAMKLSIDSEASFDFDCQVSMGSCNYPEGWGDISKEKQNYINTHFSGTFGQGESQGRKVEVDVSQGGLTIEKYLNQK